MTRPQRIIRNIAIGAVGLIAVVIVAGLIVSQTGWFQNYVREKIISSTADSVGGRVEVGSFRYDYRHFQAVITDFFIHGNEPADAAPFVHVARVQVNLRLFTSIHHLLDVAYLGVERPEVNVIMLPDGRTNIPTPRNKTVSNQPPLETVVDLAVGHFELTNGLVAVASQKQNLAARGENLRALLTYNALSQGYQGQLSFEPLYVASGRNTPVRLQVTLPVALQRDRIDLHRARITSAESDLFIEGSIENLRDPKISAHLNGRVAVADIKNLANLPLATGAKTLPSSVELDANTTVANNSIQVTGLRLALGRSIIQASGPLKAPNGGGALDFKAQLALGELGRLAKITGVPNETVSVNGSARLDASNNYRLDTSIGNFNLRGLAQSLGQKQLPYDGVLSGTIEASGNLNTVAKSFKATAKLSITPGTPGIPVSGRLNADYDAPTGNVAIRDSYIALPHSRLSISGSANKQLDVALTSTNLNDFWAATSMAAHPPVVLQGGQASFNGQLTGNLRTPRITGHLAVNKFSIEGRAFDQFSADAAAWSAGASVRNASLNRGSMQIQASAVVGLRSWKPLPNEPISANASIRDGDLADLIVLAGRSSTDYSGMLSGDLAVTGTVGNPQGSAELTATKGMLAGQPYDRIQGQVNLSDRLVTVSNSFIESGTQRINLNARFEHPRDSLTTGSLDAHVDSKQIDLAELLPLQKERPDTAGMLQLNANLSATLSQKKAGDKPETEFLLNSINADASARGLHSEGHDYGDLNLSAHTTKQTVRYNLNSNFAGSNIRVTGDTQLARGYPTNADANLANLPIQRVLVLAHRTDIPAKGNLSASAHFTGTVENPQGNLDLDLANAVVYDEPIDHVRARLTYLPQTIDVSQFELAAGPSRIDLNARYDHPSGNFEEGHLEFHVNSSRIDLARIRNVTERRPGLTGSLEIAANGTTDIRAREPRVTIRDLNTSVKATGLALGGKNLGDLNLTANTAAGRLNFALDSNLANASIHGQGNAQLADNYPLDAQLTFSNVKWTALRPLVSSSAVEPPLFDALAEGQVTVHGPATKVDELSGSLQVTRLELISISPALRTANTVLLANQGPISATLDHSIVRIASAHVTGPQTDFRATGTIPLHNQAMNLALNGNLNLAIAQRFSQDITSSGSIALAATVQGMLASPLLDGRIELHNGSFNYASIPNGISNANGVIVFNRNAASISNLTAESGGGKITVSGFASVSREIRFGLKANASNVRVLINQGGSLAANATINLSGTPQASLISGNVTITRITYAPQTDIGSILAAAAPPVEAASAPSPILDGMKLDLHVRSSNALAVQASLAENLQADADLRVRGTVSHPGVLGRITINEGKLVFFGSTYTVNSGTIGFYNPFRIAPVLNMNLETVAKGVDVTVQVAGPIDNLKLSYTSDPPLQFQEIVALLAAGTTPTSDPNLLVNQPSLPPQSFEQMGESALVGQALVNPAANRLQRVFGVSQLKIDPTFTNGSQLPQAQLTLQQRVAENITFTYVTALNNSNAQTIEVEVSLNPQWSAVATRDYNGIFSINLLYKKQFR